MTGKEASLSYPLAEMLNDASIDRVAAIDAEWRIIAWNKSSEIISGLNKTMVIGKFITDVFTDLHADEEMLEAIQAALKGYKTFVPASAAFSHRSYYECHFIPLHNSDNIIVGVMHLMHDVSHRIKTEQQLLRLNNRLQTKNAQLQKAASELSTYTFITSHDIKAPLMQIYLSLEHIIRVEGANLSNSSKAGFRKMQSSLNRMRLLLDDITKLSELNSPLQEKQETDLNHILERVKKNLRHRLNGNEATIMSEELPTYYGYPELLFQLFFQIIDNAFKFRDPSVKPVLHIVYKLTAKPVTVSNIPANHTEYLQISFTDNGIGFDTGKVDVMFELFGRLHAPGTFPGSGIGLTICKKIVDIHEGFITVDSTIRKGSAFHVFLPANM
ncbi:MAG: PAS domain-containing protein [Chitinophagaceae bacterium]|nr:PAS domain-containing protein [Chitinophagaceae bacterium]